MGDEQIRTEAAEGERDRRFHGGAPDRLDDDELARRTTAERVEAGIEAYDPNDVPPATDEEPQTDITTSAVYQDIAGVAARQESKGETTPLSADKPFPPTRYEEQ
jgi:hypothetical protein